MSKVYVLYKEDIFSNEENVNVVAVFSSYASMLLWLKEQWSFESDVEDLACLYVEAEFDEAYTDNYTKQEFVNTLRRLADSLEKYV